MCYTPKMSEDSKKMVKGFSTSAGGCTTTFVESTDTKLINETVCNNPDVKSHSIVETTKNKRYRICDDHEIGCRCRR